MPSLFSRAWGRVVRASAGAAALVGVACGKTPGLPERRLSLEETLGSADTAGFARAVEPRAFVFPADHGPHPEFRHEWWYVTGNLEGKGARSVGFQLTFFRTSLAPRAQGNRPAFAGPGDASRSAPSAWRTDQAFMGHFALTDVQGGRFLAFERFARGALGLAGAGADPLRVWIEDWVLEGSGTGPGAAGVFPIRLRAAEADVALDLVLDAGKPVVLQGELGLSRKGMEPGNASYYYSFTRLPTFGTVTLGADTLRVSGYSWLDREWGTSALPPGVVGWDWFALQLDDGSDLMVYALRMADGSAHPFSEGVLVDPSGAKRALAWGEGVSVTPTGSWNSPADGAVYPSGWRLVVPGAGLVLEVEPVLANQELDLAFRYWEGAVRVRGSVAGRPLGGRGYVELTGYAGRRPER